MTRRSLVELFARDRQVHPYGLADLDSPYWERSSWWQDGDAAVGLVELPEADAPVVYAVSARAPVATLDLLARLDPDLPDRFVVTGPVGLAERLATTREAAWVTPYLKMHLAHPDRPADVARRIAVDPPGEAPVVDLTVDDLPELRALYARDPDAGDFFFPHLLDVGPYVGRRVDGALVAAAGVHVLSRANGVAAIGNVATHPAHRRRGHALALVAVLCRRLTALVPTVGLNVGRDNLAAQTLYRRLGFVELVPYEEADLHRR